MSKTTTINGYDLHECLSALQKEIRRGNEEEAYYWALEIESFNQKALWNRLRIIASEDIGLANNSMSILINALARSYEVKKEALFIGHAVLALSRSVKSRIVDDFVKVVHHDRDNGKKLKIPDYALDMHTFKGKLMGRGFKHFHEVGSQLINESPKIKNNYKKRAEIGDLEIKKNE